MDWNRFQSQFRETEWERRERQRKARIRAGEEGRCWQCGKPIDECQCPNLGRERPVKTA